MTTPNPNPEKPGASPEASVEAGTSLKDPAKLVPMVPASKLENAKSQIEQLRNTSKKQKALYVDLEFNSKNNIQLLLNQLTEMGKGEASILDVQQKQQKQQATLVGKLEQLQSVQVLEKKSLMGLLRLQDTLSASISVKNKALAETNNKISFLQSELASKKTELFNSKKANTEFQAALTKKQSENDRLNMGPVNKIV